MAFSCLCDFLAWRISPPTRFKDGFLAIRSPARKVICGFGREDLRAFSNYLYTVTTAGVATAVPSLEEGESESVVCGSRVPWGAPAR